MRFIYSVFVSGLYITYILGLKYANASDPCVSNPSEHRMSVHSNCWANDESVRRALHVGEGEYRRMVKMLS